MSTQLLALDEISKLRSQLAEAIRERDGAKQERRVSDEALAECQRGYDAARAELAEACKDRNDFVKRLEVVKAQRDCFSVSLGSADKQVYQLKSDLATERGRVKVLREALVEFPGRSCGEPEWNRWVHMMDAALAAAPAAPEAVK